MAIPPPPGSVLSIAPPPNSVRSGGIAPPPESFIAGQEEEEEEEKGFFESVFSSDEPQTLEVSPVAETDFTPTTPEGGTIAPPPNSVVMPITGIREDEQAIQQKVGVRGDSTSGLRDRALVMSAEYSASRKLQQEVISDTASKVRFHDKKFGWGQRNMIRMAAGQIGKEINALFEAVTGMYEIRANLIAEVAAEKEMPPSDMPLRDQTLNEIAIARGEQIDSLTQRIEEALDDLYTAQIAQANPQVSGPGGLGDQPIDVEPNPAMVAIAEAEGNPALQTALMNHFFPEVLAEVLIPSITQMGWKQILVPGGTGLAMKYMLGSRLAAEVGFATANAGVSYYVESNASFVEFLREEGYDVSKTEEVERALTNPETVKKALAFSRKAGLGVGIFDWAAAFLAAKRLFPPGMKSKVAQNFTNTATQIAIQTGAGGAGEVAKQVFTGTKFSEVKSSDVKLEIIGGIATAFAEPAIFALSQNWGKSPKELASLEKLVEAVIQTQETDINLVFEALQDAAKDGMTYDETFKLLMAIPGIDQSKVELMLFDDHVEEDAPNAMSPTDETVDALDKTIYETTSGNVKDGKRIFADKTTKGVVYWATDQRVGNDGPNTSTGTAIEAMELAIQTAKLEIDIAKSQKVPPSDIARMENFLGGLTERYQKKLRESIAMQEVRGQLHQLVQEMVTMFMPNQNMIIVEDVNSIDEWAPDHAGQSALIRRHGGNRTNVIHINTATLMDMGLIETMKTSGSKNASVMTSVLGHEFGHALMQTLVTSLPKPVRDALHMEYRKSIQRATKKGASLKSIIYNIKTPITGHWQTKRRPGGDAWDTTWGIDKIPDVDYHLSFTEYLADMMARSWADKDNIIIAPVTKRFIPRISKVMQKYFDKTQERGSAEETYTTFLNYIQLKARQDAMTNFKNSFTPEELKRPLSGGAKDLMDLVSSKGLDIPKEIANEIGASLDRYNGLVKNFLTLLQLGKENPHVVGLQEYIEAVHQHWVTKSNWNDQAMQTLNEWRSLGMVGDEVGRFLLARSVMSDELGRKLTNDEIQDLLKDENINFGKKGDKAWSVIQRVEGDLLNSLNQLYVIEKNRINKDWADMNTMRLSKLQDLDKLFNQLRDRNYFPLSRFGDLGIIIKAVKTTQVDGRTYIKGDTIHMEMFETSSQRNKGLAKLRRKFGKNFMVEPFQIKEDLQSFSGMPLAIMRQLKDNPAIGLNEEQRARMQDLIDIMSPTQSIAKRMLERKGTAGFSADAQRGYGNYMMQIGGHIAKMKHMGQMNAAIDSVQKSARYLGSQGIINDKRYAIVEHLNKHKEYIMNPESEWGAMRALAFHWFLGFNPKSALVNLTQIPLVAYPYIAARHQLTGTKIPGKSDAIAIAALTKAMADVGNFFRNGVNKYSPEAQEMFDILTAEGIIDESLATELAQQAHGDMISRVLPAENKIVRGGQRAWNGLARGSTIMFQAAEKLNRRVVAKAVFEMARKQGMTQTQAISEAREALRTTQFEYARWNRAAFMRGKKGVLFVFMQYLQNTLYFVSRDPGAVRYAMMMFMAAGLQGLPGAEDLMDVLDVFSVQFKKWLKIEGDPRADIRMALREYIRALHMSPELIMHGLSSQSFGLGMQSVNDMLGTSMPSFSLEGSVSAGRIIPGLEALSEILQGHKLSGSGAVEGAKDIAGAAITIPVNIMRWLIDTDPSQIRSLERMVPSILKSNLRAFRARNEGKLTDRSGKTIVEFDMSNHEHMAEIIGMHLGLTPTRLAREQEVRWSQKEATQFYVESRARMQVAFNWAMEEVSNDVTGARERLTAVKAEIKRFNRHVPKGQRFYTQAEGYINYKKSQGMSAHGLDNRIMNKPLRDEIRESYEEPSP